MTEKKRKIHVVGINSYKFEDLSLKLQNLFQETVSIAVPNSYFEEIKSWSENGLEKKKLFFSSNSNKELVNWLRSKKTDVILISRGDPLWFGIGRILLENFSKDELSFYPSNTCIQLAFSKLKISWQDTVNVSIHGRDSTRLVEALKARPSSLAIITDSHNKSLEIIKKHLLELNNKELIELRRNKMGMVFQSFALLPHKTVVENIAFPLQIKGTNTEESISRAMEMVKLVGLDGRENYFPRELSGGQQQRVGIARSLAVEPDIWFLDEPFSALDPLIRKEMQDEFLRLQEKLQKTIMFITHDFDEALKLADRIAIMKDGIIEQLDTPANIVLNPATEYVRKFTEEVPREKVLIIEDVMDASSKDNLGDLKVSKDEIIENVAEKILTQEKLVGVVDSNNNIVGSIKPSKIIDTVFGGRKNGS